MQNYAPSQDLGPEVAEHEERIPLSQFLQVFRRYRIAIGVSLAAILGALILLLVPYVLLQPARRITTMNFHLQFAGADNGKYPNGTTFSTADILANPVLLAVYKANRLEDYIPFSEFSRSVFILETSRAYENLNREYELKLRDPKLTTIDRERIEREYRDKLAGLGKLDHSINFVAPTRVRNIPTPVIRKALGDILSQWAAQAERDKRVFQFAVPVLSANILRRPVTDESFFRRLLLLRHRLAVLIANIEGLETAVPAAAIVRAGAERISLAEIRLDLQDIGRYDIDPLIAVAHTAGLTGTRESAMRVLQAQLEFDRRALSAARARETALRNAFQTYEAGAARAPESDRPNAPASSGAVAENGDAITAQLGESFLDRIVDLSNRSADREYRQQLITDMRNAALEVAPLEAIVAYDESLIAQLQTSAFGADRATAADVQRRWTEITSRVENAVRQMNAIYAEASQQMNAETELYRITSPAATRVERPTSHARLLLIALLVVVGSIPLILAGCLLHDRLTSTSAERALRTSEAAV